MDTVDLNGHHTNLFQYGVRHGIIVVCHNLLSCGIYTALVFLVSFGTAIPTSFSINENVLHFHTVWVVLCI